MQHSLGDESKLPLDVFSGVHALSGFTMGVIGVPRPIAYVLILLVELFEIVAVAFGSKFFRETPADIVTDIVIGVVAFELGRLAR